MVRMFRFLASALRALGLLCLGLPVAVAAARAAPPGQALVIGEAAYAGLPAAPACALSAQRVAAALRGLGFTVVEQQNTANAALFNAIASLIRNLRANPGAPTFVYMCSHVTSFDDRPFLLPVSAVLTRPADVLAQGLLARSLVDAVVANSQATAVIALDAIPAPGAPPSLSLHRLATDLPSRLGVIAVRDAGSDTRPTPFAATLVRALHGTVQSADLLDGVTRRLAAVPASQVKALKLPAKGLLLATQPLSSATAAAVPTPVAAPAAAASPPPTVAPTPLPDQDQMTAAQRRRVQRALARQGRYTGRIDGIFGPLTRAAIRRWQRSANLPATGHLSAAEATRLVGG